MIHDPDFPDVDPATGDEAETMLEPTGCAVVGCRGVHEARGLCSKHYQRWRRGGTTDSHVDEDDSLVCVCAVPIPGHNDQCDRCRRVIAALVQQRRLESAATPAFVV